MTQEELIKMGEQEFKRVSYNNPCNLKMSVTKITSIEEWISSHDDSAVFIRLYNELGEVVWSTNYVVGTDHAGQKADALGQYLQSQFDCPIEKDWFSADDEWFYY